MLKALKKMLLVIVLLPAATYGAEPGSLNGADGLLQYRCEIITKYIYLKKTNNEFGNILLSGNFENIFVASKAALQSLDTMKHDLESMNVPGQMREPYDVFLKSIQSYRQSADLIRVAVGVFLGNYERNGVDIQELIDRSERHVVMANKYLDLSIVLHGELFETYTQGPSECNKYVAGI